MSMYPDEQTVVIDGKEVSWPGLIGGKFSSGDFDDPAQKPSFIPAETINLLVDNIASLITKLGGAPNNAAIDQLANAFTAAAVANKGVCRDEYGRTKMVAPAAFDDVAIRQTVDDHAALTAAGTHGSTIAATANRGVHRDASGRTKMAAPSASDDVAIRQTVDDHAALTAAGTHGSTVAATANRGMHRDANGRSQVANPSADADVANRGWVRDYIYPVGETYTQYPAANSNNDADEFPVSGRPASKFGGTWAEQWATESVYFRTRGTLSDDGRTNGKQEDALQGHGHNLRARGNSTGAGMLNASSDTGADVNIGDILVREAVSDGVHGTPRIASETRVVNRRLKVWKRTA